ncbi:MAG: hypothetical protein ACP5P1_13235 [Acidimicrobiales bacterium]
MEVARQLENLEEAGESIEFEPLDPDEEAAILATEEEEERRWNEEAFLDSLSNEEVPEYFEEKKFWAARKAAKGMSDRSRREMWRWVLSLPLDMLGDRPLWITLTYPGDWGPWGPTAGPSNGTAGHSEKPGIGPLGSGRSVPGPRISSWPKDARVSTC